jgi:hypothetical protein
MHPSIYISIYDGCKVVFWGCVAVSAACLGLVDWLTRAVLFKAVEQASTSLSTTLLPSTLVWCRIVDFFQTFLGFG